MTTTLQNNFEGIADGAALTSANSATGGTGFLTVAAGTGGTLTVKSAAAINGTRSLEVAQGSTSCYCYWDPTVLPALATAYFRFTFALTALPSAGSSVWRHMDSASVECFRLEILSTGKLRIRNSSTGVILADSTTVFTAGQAYRVEGKVVHGSTGSIQVRIYGTQNAAVPVETMTPAAADVGVDTSRVHMGRPVSTPTMPTFTLDDVAVTDVDWLGPPVVSAAPTANFTSTTSGLTASFANTSAAATGRTIASSAWAYGDGTTGATTSPSHTYAAGGTYTATLTVTDDVGRTGTVSKTVTVTAPANAAPTANAGPDQAGVEPWSTVTLPGSGTDPNGTIASYRWTQTAGPAVTLSSATAQNPTFTAPAAATDQALVFSLTVTDNGGATSPADTVSVAVLAATEFYANTAGVWTPMRVVGL